MHPAGLAGDEAAAAVEASVLAAALRARAGGPPALAAGGVPGWQHMPAPDLPSEAAWLARVARAFDRDSLGGRRRVQRTAGKPSEGVVTLADRARRGRVQGLGVVEASCKTVIGQRLKQSGMHWTVNGADAIIALRCREASSTWETIRNPPHTQTRTA